MSTLERRHFLLRAGAFAVGFTGLRAMCAASGTSHVLDILTDGYGPLTPDPDSVLDLPAGFTYQIISRAGDLMDDGLLVPSKPDGMAAFPGPQALTLLVRNHELSRGHDSDGPYGSSNERLKLVDTAKLYDRGLEPKPSRGGTTTLVYDTRRAHLVRQHLSLGGTELNCAGGPTTRGSWLSCEETTQLAGAGYEQDHGYVFEVPASDTSGLVTAQPIKPMGRFKHEAVAESPASGAVFMTEDQHDGCIYRYLPHDPSDLHAGGTLQALAIVDHPSLDVRNWAMTNTVAVGDRLAVHWVDLDDVESPDNSLRYQAFERGGARFARGEGMWRGTDAVYFACTNGGRARIGQIWKLTPSPAEGTGSEATRPGTLELFIEPNDATIVENADNLTVSPWGDLVVCEDGPGEQFLLGVTPAGTIYKLARNAYNGSEFAGATFSPDGSTLFVNIQHPHGFTLAIRGPWKKV